ncbi:hypothetical protein TNCV_4411551 [Trichonephila clavipes]|nr:hypothetical protein TNCV_4411551 [Trichonephila clavipes]
MEAEGLNEPGQSGLRGSAAELLAKCCQGRPCTSEPNRVKSLPARKKVIISKETMEEGDRPEETGGRQREKSLDYRDTGDWTTDIAFYRDQKTPRWWSIGTTPCTVCTSNACPSEKAFSEVPETPELREK